MCKDSKRLGTNDANMVCHPFLFSFKWFNRTSVLVVPLKSFYWLYSFDPVEFLIGGSIWPISFLLFLFFVEIFHFISFRLYSCTDILTKLQNHYHFQMYSSIFFFFSKIDVDFFSMCFYFFPLK